MNQISEWLKRSTVYVLDSILKGRAATQECILNLIDICNFTTSGKEDDMEPNVEWESLDEPDRKIKILDVLRLMEKEGLLLSKERVSNHRVQDDIKSPGKIRKEQFFSLNKKKVKV